MATATIIDFATRRALPAAVIPPRDRSIGRRVANPVYGVGVIESRGSFPGTWHVRFGAEPNVLRSLHGFQFTFTDTLGPSPAA
jgi:hypothetical protein